MPALDAFSHISLTVTDPERSADFYNRVLGTETVFSRTVPADVSSSWLDRA
jgi:catechol 2,3-dioxygenase-like lactoylglutathione lyase family enzyme